MAYSFKEIRIKGCCLFNGRPTTDPANQATDTRSVCHFLWFVVASGIWASLAGLRRPGAVHCRPTGPPAQSTGDFLSSRGGRGPPHDLWPGAEGLSDTPLGRCALTPLPPSEICNHENITILSVSVHNHHSKHTHNIQQFRMNKSSLYYPHENTAGFYLHRF